VRGGKPKMIASALIERLLELIDKHGDLPVENEYGHPIKPPEYNNYDSNDPFIIISFEGSSA
jgi:hypothetical protein